MSSDAYKCNRIPARRGHSPVRAHAIKNDFNQNIRDNILQKFDDPVTLYTLYCNGGYEEPLIQLGHACRKPCSDMPPSVPLLCVSVGNLGETDKHHVSTGQEGIDFFYLYSRWIKGPRFMDT